MSKLRISFMTRRTAFTAAAMALTAAGLGFGPSIAADMSDNDKVIAAAGKTDDKSFCGTKPIVLGIHDGFGINGWSKSAA